MRRADFEMDETIEIASANKLAEMKESNKHIAIKASIVGTHLYDNRLIVIDVGNSTTGSRFSVPKDKAKELVTAMNRVLL
jgi:hypothetical protein